jgi:uncharacterized protein YjdB
MKRNKLNILFAVGLLFAFLTAGCDDNFMEIKQVAVESIDLKPELANGLTVETGDTYDISWKIIYTPADATDRAESYSSSNTDVATVSPKGLLTTYVEGTSDITITAGGKSVTFKLTVEDPEPIPASALTLSITALNLELETTYDLASRLIFTPFDANDPIDYVSSNPDVVTVSDRGLLTGIAVGQATVTVTSKWNPALTATLSVSVTLFIGGDYPRTGWTMTASHGLPVTTADTERNSLKSALDGDYGTQFSLVKPGKSYGNNPNISVATGEALHFTVNMTKPTKINYFRIRHRDQNQLFLRWRMFEQILISNDGINFVELASDVAIPDWGVATQQETVNIAIPESTCQYIRFYAQKAGCWDPDMLRSTVQIQELYLGLTLAP